MNAPMEIATGSARSVGRRISTASDLLSLYAQLSSNGARADTMLFETTAGKSIILDRAAVRIECRGGKVVLDALSANGGPVLQLVRRNLAEQVESASGERLMLRYERSREIDAGRRLL
ncbi:MAG TPA: hypothetical protein VFU87_07405, partial [Sphingomicrobium sp.]|nr:hypothetical protein [Sphingomicrobium sp.]